MSNFEFKGTKHKLLRIDDIEQMSLVAKALSNPLRLNIIKLLGEKTMNVNELAERLDVPISTVALSVRTLEEAELITTEMRPGVRGAMKLSSRSIDSVGFELVSADEKHSSVLSTQMPVGGYSYAGNIKPTCGLVSRKASIASDDMPRSFFVPERFQAQLIWFREGYVEYLFSFPLFENIHIDWLELSFEACSEAPMYRDPWKSDIHVSLNDVLLGVWTSPCDCGGRRGRLNPSWWDDLNTQFGFLKTFRVDKERTTLDGMYLSDVKLADLKMLENMYIKVRIEVPADTPNVGGVNIFGEGFGDYPQGIGLQMGYRLRNKQESCRNLHVNDDKIQV